MAADDPSDFLIRARLDTSDVATGADEGVTQIGRLGGALEDVGGSAEKGEKGIAKMLEEAGGMQEARRLTAGLFDVLEGGGRTVAGLTDLLRFMLLTVVDINPVMLGLTVIFGSLAAAAAEHYAKVKEGKTDTDELAASTEKLNQKLKETAAVLKDFAVSMGEEYSEASSALDEIAKADTERTATLSGQLELLGKITQATLEGARASALAANTGGPEGAQRINQSFDQLESGASAQTAMQRLQVTARGHIEEYQRDRAELDRERGHREDLSTTLNDIYKDVVTSRHKADAYGIRPDEHGSYDKAIGSVEGDLYNARKEQQDTLADKERDRNVGVLSKDELDEKYRGALRDNETNVRALTFALEIANQASLATQKFSEAAPELEKQLEESKKRIAELTQKVATLPSAIHTDFLNQGFADQQNQNSTDALATKYKQAALEQANKEYAARNEAAIAAQQSIIDDPDSLVADKEKALAQASQLRVEALQRQIDQGAAPGPNNLSADDTAALRSKIDDEREDLRRKRNQMEVTEMGVPTGGRREYDTASAALAELVAQGMARVNAGSNVEEKNMLNSASDDRSRAQLLANLFATSGDGGERDLSKRLGKSLSDQSDASTRTGPANQYDQLVGRQADLVEKISGLALADGLTKLVTVTEKGHETQSKINDIIIAGYGSADTRLVSLEQQLEKAQSQINSLRTNRH